MTTFLRYFRAVVYRLAVLAMAWYAVWVAAANQWQTAGQWTAITLLVLLAAWQPDRAQLVADLKTANKRGDAAVARHARTSSLLEAEATGHRATAARLDRLMRADRARIVQIGELNAALDEHRRDYKQLRETIARLQGQLMDRDAAHADLSGQLQDARERLSSFELAEAIADETRAKRHFDGYGDES